VSRRIRVGRGTHKRFTADLTRRLKQLSIIYRDGMLSKEQTRTKAKRIIDAEFEVLLAVSRNRVKMAVGKVGELPPEERRRLEQWRNEYLKDFYGILDDAKRRGT